MPTKLGQNFLKNKDIAKKIVKSANLSPSDFVLEIGPGKGILTEELAKAAGKVMAVEIDRNLVKILGNKFKDSKNVEIFEGDVLKISLKKLLWSEAPKYKIVANLPYYITSPVVRLFLEAENPPTEMILMVQKEVAERITASPREIPTESRGVKRISRGKPGEMSILAVSVQYYAKPELLFYVGKENFDPMPEVDSAVIKITYNQRPTTYNKEETKKFFRIVRAGFCAKRKILANNLANSFHLDKKTVEKKVKAAGISPTARAQDLSVEDWEKLSRLFNS